MDDLDCNMLKALKQNGRFKNKDLAEKFGVSPSTIMERTRRLETREFIKGYHADINLKNLGFMIQGFMTITTTQSNKKNSKIIEKQLSEIPHILTYYRVTGQFDYILHVVAKNFDHFNEAIIDRILEIPGINRFETFFMLSEKVNDNWEEILLNHQ